MPKRHLVFLATLLLLLPPAVSGAQARIPDDKITIGILQDQPEPYASETGTGALAAAQMAASDFEKSYFSGDAEILSGDSTGGMQADLRQVQEWLDKDDVAAVVSSASAPVNQRIAKLLEQHHRTLLIAEAAAGAAAKVCSPNVIIWGAGEDSRMRALAQIFTQQNKTNWYFIGAGNPAGLASLDALNAALAATHGQLAGQTRNVVGALDFGGAVQAINKTNADVAVLAEGDGDLIRAIRSLVLDRPSHAVTFAAPYAQIEDIDEAGPTSADGLVVVAPFYWDQNKQTRAFSRAWSDNMSFHHVTEDAAEVYAATSSFLNAAKHADDIDSGKVGAELRRAPLPHTLFGPATVRADGRVLYNVNIYRVKPPSQIQHRWDYYDMVASVPGDQAFPPSSCGQPPAKSAANPPMQKTAGALATSTPPSR